MLLHHTEELNNNLRRGADQHLALAALLGVVDVLQAVVQNAHAHHDGRL